MRAILAALAALAGGSVHPWPVGRGLSYMPPPAPPAVVAGRPVGDLRCTMHKHAFRLHLELFAGRRAIVVPAGIGVAAPLVRTGATVSPRGCSYPVRTVAPDGIVEIAAGARLRLADLFRIWGQPLEPRRLLSFHSSQLVRVYLDGRLVRGPAGAVLLTRHAQIVLEIGAYVAPHPFFLFTGGDS